MKTNKIGLATTGSYPGLNAFICMPFEIGNGQTAFRLGIDVILSYVQWPVAFWSWDVKDL